MALVMLLDNPFIAEVCDHYPEAFAVGSTAGRVACNCADCFYCDGNDDEDDSTEGGVRT